MCDELKEKSTIYDKNFLLNCFIINKEKGIK